MGLGRTAVGYEMIKNLVTTHQPKLFPRDSFLGHRIGPHSAFGAPKRIYDPLQ